MHHHLILFKSVFQLWYIIGIIWIIQMKFYQDQFMLPNTSWNFTFFPVDDIFLMIFEKVRNISRILFPSLSYQIVSMQGKGSYQISFTSIQTQKFTQIIGIHHLLPFSIKISSLSVCLSESIIVIGHAKHSVEDIDSHSTIMKQRCFIF